MRVERKYEIRRVEYNPKIDPGRLENVPDILKASPLQGFIKQIQEKQEQVDQYVDDYVTECIIELGIDPDALKATAELNARLQRELRTARAMAARKPEWISVDERLPDKDGRFLTVDKKGYMMVCYWQTRFGWFASVCNKNAITHWMPLPEPPEKNP